PAFGAGRGGTLGLASGQGRTRAHKTGQTVWGGREIFSRGAAKSGQKRSHWPDGGPQRAGERRWSEGRGLWASDHTIDRAAGATMTSEPSWREGDEAGLRAGWRVGRVVRRRSSGTSPEQAGREVVQAAPPSLPLVGRARRLEDHVLDAGLFERLVHRLQ